MFENIEKNYQKSIMTNVTKMELVEKKTTVQLILLAACVGAYYGRK